MTSLTPDEHQGPPGKETVDRLASLFQPLVRDIATQVAWKTAEYTADAVLPNLGGIVVKTTRCVVNVLDVTDSVKGGRGLNLDTSVLSVAINPDVGISLHATATIHEPGQQRPDQPSVSFEPHVSLFDEPARPGTPSLEGVPRQAEREQAHSTAVVVATPGQVSSATGRDTIDAITLAQYVREYAAIRATGSAKTRVIGYLDPTTLLGLIVWCPAGEPPYCPLLLKIDYQSDGNASIRLWRLTRTR